MARTRRQEMRAMRDEDMRERIINSNLLTDIVDTIGKMAALDHTKEGASVDLNILNTTNSNRFRLLDKILPNLKALEVDVSGEVGVFEIDFTGYDEDADEEQAE